VTRVTPYKVGDVLYYGDNDQKMGIAILEEFDPKQGFTKYAWFYQGKWHLSGSDNAPAGWWPGTGNQSIWRHEDPDKIWTDYAAWRLTR
jgi:hypothetical protein